MRKISAAAVIVALAVAVGPPVGAGEPALEPGSYEVAYEGADAMVQEGVDRSGAASSMAMSASRPPTSSCSWARTEPPGPP